MNKTLLALLVAASLVACSSDNDTSADALGTDPTASGNDPITGMPADDSPVAGTTDTAATTDTTATTDDTAGPDDPDDEAPIREPSFGPAQLSPANYEAVVSEVFGIYTGRAYGAGILALPGYPGLDDQPFAGGGYEGSTSQQDVCSNGGTAALAMTWSGDRVSTIDRRGAFDNCQYDALLIDGEIQKITVDNVSIASSGLSVTDDSESTLTRFSGGAGYGDGNNYGGSNRTWWNTSELDYTVSSQGSIDFGVTGANTRYETNPPVQHDLQGSFTLQYGGTGGGKVRVETPVAFSHEGVADFDDPAYDFGAWNFQTGVLTLNAGDGSSVRVEADNGDPDSARVTLAYAGRSETFDKPWSDWDDNLKGFTDLFR